MPIPERFLFYENTREMRCFGEIIEEQLNHFSPYIFDNEK